MEPDWVLEQSPTVTVVAVGDELSLFDTASGRALALNRTAADIYSLIDGTATVQHVVSELAAAYTTPACALFEEVTAAVAVLVDAGVLRPRHRPAARA